jgi:hypothetical protein
MKRTLLALALSTGGGTAAAWTCLVACSSSPGAESVAGDAEPEAEPTDDAGAPDVLADTIDTPCDPVKQDCVDPSLRCQIIYVGNQYLTGCEPSWRPPGGGVLHGEGEVCNRLKPGIDDCERGFHCIKDGADIAATSCRKFCAKDSDCGQDAKCGAITTAGPSYGLCWSTCTPFTGECGSGTCAGAHYSIDGVNTFESCREIGKGALGTSCKAQYDCATDMNCYGKDAFVCTAMCDDGHPCDGGTCTPNGVANNGGVCE